MIVQIQVKIRVQVKKANKVQPDSPAELTEKLKPPWRLLLHAITEVMMKLLLKQV